MSHSEADAGVLTPDLNWTWPSLQDAKAQIRLLHLGPGSGNEEISVAMEVYDLNCVPTFKAISYTWGTEAPDHAIKINRASISVRPNCHYALWQARHHFPGSLIWIDAICINQRDLVEKGSQVAIMGDIFAAAANVLACIGPADDDSDIVRQAVSNLDATVQVPPDEWYADPHLSQWKPPQDEDTTMRLNEAFNHFCARAYFTRVWIIQELHSGRNRITVLCGDDQLTWDALMDLYKRLQKCFDYWGDTAYFVTTGTRLREIERLINMHDQPAFPLINLLVRIKDFVCSDPRDRIFGTTRLINWSRYGKLSPAPDYQISLLQLAFNMIVLLDKVNLYILRELVRVLRLDDQETSFETWMRTKRRDLDSERGWKTIPSSAHLIQRSTGGQLFIDLDAKNSAKSHYFWSAEDFLWPPQSLHDNETTLIADDLVQIFAGDDVAALITIETQPGDIMVACEFGDLVLRPQPDGFNFAILGPALSLASHLYAPALVDQECVCWKEEQLNTYTQEFIQLALELSDDEAMIALASWAGVQSGNCNEIRFLNHYSMGALKRGSMVADVTMANLGKDRTIGPSRAICAKHQSSENYRSSGKAFWNNIVSGGDMVIRVK